MASEVPTNDKYVLVTCGLFTLKRIFTLKPRNTRSKKEVTYKVPRKFK